MGDVVSASMLVRCCEEKEKLYKENQKMSGLLKQTIDKLEFFAWRLAHLKDESGVIECSNLSQQIEGGKYYNYRELRAKLEAKGE